MKYRIVEHCGKFKVEVSKVVGFLFWKREEWVLLDYYGDPTEYEFLSIDFRTKEYATEFIKKIDRQKKEEETEPIYHYPQMHCQYCHTENEDWIGRPCKSCKKACLHYHSVSGREIANFTK